MEFEVGLEFKSFDILTCGHKSIDPYFQLRLKNEWSFDILT